MIIDTNNPVYDRVNMNKLLTLAHNFEVKLAQPAVPKGKPNCEYCGGRGVLDDGEECPCVDENPAEAQKEKTVQLLQLRKRIVNLMQKEQVLLREVASTDCEHCRGTGVMQDGGDCVCFPHVGFKFWQARR